MRAATFIAVVSSLLSVSSAAAVAKPALALEDRQACGGSQTGPWCGCTAPNWMCGLNCVSSNEECDALGGP